MARKKDYRECKVTPFHSGVSGFTDIPEYYLYFAPGVDSVHSGKEIPDANGKHLES